MTNISTAVSVRNISDVTQNIFVDGVRYEIPAQELRVLPEDIAKEFIQLRGRFIQKYQEVKIPPPLGPYEKAVWIANASGNPLITPEVFIRKRNRKEHSWDMVASPNPLLVPRVVMEDMHTSERIVSTPEGDGETSLHFPPIRIEIPPFIRVPVPEHVAEFLLRRDNMREEHLRGQICQVRPPSEWEANDSWSYEDLRTYAFLLDRQGIRPETFWSPGVYADASRLQARIQVARAHNDIIYLTLSEAKLELWKRIFFRLIDERYGLPSREEFASAKADSKIQISILGNEEANKAAKENAIARAKAAKADMEVTTGA